VTNRTNELLEIPVLLREIPAVSFRFYFSTVSMQMGLNLVTNHTNYTSKVFSF